MTTPNELRIYSIISLEALAAMNGSRGKLVAQAAHSTLHTWWDAYERFPKVAKAYQSSGAAVKIALTIPQDLEIEDILTVDTTDQLSALLEAFQPVCGVSLVTDAGRTVFKEPTTTFLGVGPITKERFNEIAPGLKTLQ